jgi:2-hydroxy-6-oxonona-2,4-dienedioate hydrolase
MDFHILNIDNLKIRYAVGGSKGELVLLIHGLGGSIESWVNNIDTLSKEFKVIALDLPGFGLSDKPIIDYTIPFYTNCITKFLRILSRTRRVSIVGASLGGQIAEEITLRHPELVSKLVLISPAGALPKSFKGTPSLDKYVSIIRADSVRETKKALSAVDRHNKLIDDKHAEISYHRLSLPGAKHAFVSALRGSSQAARLDKRLDRIKPKMLLIWGKDDQIIPVKFTEPFVNLRNCRIILIENSGHQLYFTRHSLFNKYVSDFIKETTAV